MKILVLQLARFGDIYQTWPALRALRRKYPEAQIDFVVRERFQGACAGLGANINVIAFPTAVFLHPVILQSNLEDSLERLGQWLAPLQEVQYERIINLSFSPSSSFLTQILSSANTSSNTLVSGYTRHSDGSLHIPDDTSAYFYAQVGIGRGNRYHLTQILASVCGVDLVPSDWNYFGDFPEFEFATESPYILIHVGASDLGKAYTPFKFTQAIKKLEAEWSGRIYLIGTQDEASLGRQIVEGSGLQRTQSIIGKTTLPQLFSMVKGAELVVGADSAPIHVASHVGARVLNLSFDQVNFWETGPVSPGSQILVADSPESMPSDQVARTILSLLNGEQSNEVWRRVTYLGDYETTRPNPVDFRWQLIQAIYTGAPFPTCEDKYILLGFKRLFEFCDLALCEMTRAVDGLMSPTSLQIMAHIDSLLVEIPTLVRELQPVVDWFQAERIRIPPGQAQDAFLATESAFLNFKTLLQVYIPDLPVDQVRSEGIDMCGRLATSLSEWDLKSASHQLNDFLEMCRTLARVSPKVGDSQLEWSQVLKDVQVGFENKDYLRLADLIQHEISPALQNWVS